MTRGACNLVLHISIISLSWRSVKALKRPTFGRKNLNDSCINDGSINAVDTPRKIDTELLQLWALFALQKIYSCTGLEGIISMFPMYYYVKMIIVVITFIPGTRFPDFWFTSILVPLMDQCHIIMNLDWKGFLKREALLLPWRVLDLLIIPGLISDDEAEIVKKLRIQELDNLYCDEEGSYVTSLQNSHDSEKRATRFRRNSSFSSPIARSRVAASSMHVRKFSTDHETKSTSTETGLSSLASKRKGQKDRIRKKTLTRDSGTQKVIRHPPMTAFSRTNTKTNYTTVTKKKKREVVLSSTKVKDLNSEDNGTVLNHRLRKFITGDSNIRVRDYLFDINMPAPPSTVVSQKKAKEMERDVRNPVMRPNKTSKSLVEGKDHQTNRAKTIVSRKILNKESYNSNEKNISRTSITKTSRRDKGTKSQSSKLSGKPKKLSTQTNQK